jgi:hypothetical protein
MRRKHAVTDFRQTDARDNQPQTVSRAQTASSRQTRNRSKCTQIWRRMHCHVTLNMQAQPVRTGCVPAQRPMYTNEIVCQMISVTQTENKPGSCILYRLNSTQLLRGKSI